MIRTFVDANADANAAAARAESEGTRTNGTNAFAEDVLNNLAQEVDDECPICMDVQQSPMIIPGCLHQWSVSYPCIPAGCLTVFCSCKDCITAFIQKCSEEGRLGRCPTCSREPVAESDLLEVIRAPKTENNGDGVTSTVTLRRNDFRSSTKLEALLQNLRVSPSMPLHFTRVLQ